MCPPGCEEYFPGDDIRLCSRKPYWRKWGGKRETGGGKKGGEILKIVGTGCPLLFYQGAKSKHKGGEKNERGNNR